MICQVCLLEGLQLWSDTTVGGAKIRDIFQNEFCRSLKEIDRRSELSNETIITTIRNSTGMQSWTAWGKFIPQGSLDRC